MRTYQLTKALAEEHDVTLMAFRFEGERYVEPDLDVVFETVDWTPSSDLADMQGTDEDAARRATTRLQSPDSPPWFAAYYENALVRERVSVLSRDSDVVVFEGSDMALFMDAVSGDARLCVDLMDVYSSIAMREAERSEGTTAAASLAEAERVLRYERDVVRRADLCLTVSDREAHTATKTLGGTAVEVIANGVDVRYYTPSSEPADGGHVLFTGSLNYPPNIEAARYFHDEIFPLVMEVAPGATFHMAGMAPVEEILELESAAVFVHGSVPDMRPIFARAQVVVVPLLSGGGTRLKILEAAAAGRPIVSTSLGAEGLELQDGSEILLADHPDDFARHVVGLLGDGAERDRLATAARAASLRYDWQEIGANLLRVVKELA
jgi:glycosyltransferase involved in cell wall biosynthesis